MVPSFDSNGLADGLTEMDEASKARLEEWKEAINKLPDTEDFDTDTLSNQAYILIQGALDVGFDEHRSHDVFYQFNQGDRALLTESCNCSSGSLCPARQAKVRFDGTWNEAYAEMVKLLKNKANQIPQPPV